MSQQNLTTLSEVELKYAIETTQDVKADVYKMDHKHRGVAIIFNHYEFNDSSLKKREGTEKDVEALQECLPLLGFKPSNIIVKKNLSKFEILQYSHDVRYNKKEVFDDCDCIAIFILSHGSKGTNMYARDDDYDLYKLVDQYTPNNFKQLTGKPKLFFINASRDGKSEGKSSSGQQIIDTTDANSELLIVSYPIDADILFSMSSHHQHTSFRDEDGSWYIQDLCKVIRMCNEQNILDKVEITELLMYMHRLVSERISDDKLLKQTPNYTSSLCRKIYFE